MRDHSAIVIFAKAPQPGFAKTRLIPALGVDGAAELAAVLLDHTLNECLATRATQIILAQSPAPADPAWRDTELLGPIDQWDQGGGDLGDRLARCAAQALANYERVLLIGSDAPTLTARLLDAAITTLNSFDAVLTPARDGGYALLGLTRFDRSLFTNMPWSTNRVAAITEQRLRDSGFSVHLTDPVVDIDEPEDLDALPARLRARLPVTS
ncbi:MAG: TIGR04282 family arsenosugar biosynthesis glycosyltransferase [Pseudomonadota bacterium]